MLWNNPLCTLLLLRWREYKSNIKKKSVCENIHYSVYLSKIKRYKFNNDYNIILLQRAAAAPHQSLCAEMLEELCFALRCRGSRRRPALKRQCSKCVPGTTYVPASFDLPPANNGLRSQVENMNWFYLFSINRNFLIRILLILILLNLGCRRRDKFYNILSW